MTIWDSLLLGLVEGLTEFLPISSTFHLIATTRILALPHTDFLKLFEVVIQGGAILSLTARYLPLLLTNARLRLQLVASFVPTAFLGALFYPLIKSYFFDSTVLQLSVFVLIGLLFLIYESYISRHDIKLTKTLSDLSLKEAVLIGALQAASMVPGVSRSGAILLTMLLLRYHRATAAEYAFLLSLPTILAATTLDLYQNRDLLLVLTPDSWLLLFTGIIAAFVTATLVMRWLLHYLSSHNLNLFGYYRLLAALILSQLL